MPFSTKVAVPVEDLTIGPELVGLTATRNWRVMVSAPPLRVPPLSVTVTVMIAEPDCPAWGV